MQITKRCLVYYKPLLLCDASHPVLLIASISYRLTTRFVPLVTGSGEHHPSIVSGFADFDTRSCFDGVQSGVSKLLIPLLPGFYSQALVTWGFGHGVTPSNSVVCTFAMTHPSSFKNDT